MSNIEKTIYNLELHESLVTEFGICIMRVPSGWIYDCWDIKEDCFKDGVFVPFHDEFQIKNSLNKNRLV